MDPATISLIVMLISYMLSAKSGKSKGTSAAIAAGAGLATYYATSPDGLNLLGKLDSANTGTVEGDPALNAEGSNVKKGTSATIGLNGAIGTAGDVLKSWGATGTAAVIGTTAVASDSNLKKYLPWLLIAGAFILLK